jgi:hypothetical protein
MHRVVINHQVIFDRLFKNNISNKFDFFLNFIIFLVSYEEPVSKSFKQFKQQKTKRLYRLLEGPSLKYV